jgi:hypothetical protein
MHAISTCKLQARWASSLLELCLFVSILVKTMKSLTGMISNEITRTDDHSKDQPQGEDEIEDKKDSDGQGSGVCFHAEMLLLNDGNELSGAGPQTLRNRP